MKLCSLLQRAFVAPETRGKEKKKAYTPASKQGVQPSASLASARVFGLHYHPVWLLALLQGTSIFYAKITLSRGSRCDPCTGGSVPSGAWLYKGSWDFFQEQGDGKGETEAGGSLL